ncbi:MAG TPA: hypothetical protein VGJ18_19510 [Gemmatimonadaceae bacterium]
MKLAPNGMAKWIRAIHLENALQPSDQVIPANDFVDRRLSDLSAARSPRINASFFFRVHRFNCRSRAIALTIEECSSA